MNDGDDSELKEALWLYWSEGSDDHLRRCLVQAVALDCHYEIDAFLSRSSHRYALTSSLQKLPPQPFNIADSDTVV